MTTRTTIDVELHTDVDTIASRAQTLVDDVRDIDPRLTLRTLTLHCRDHPGQMAQILMCLAAWVNPDEPLNARGARVEAITTSRTAA
jgi:hypothetical protein